MSDGRLTLRDLENMFDAMWNEWPKREAERARFENAGYILLSKALEQGIITENEHLYLASTIAINGGLIVSTAMNERLKQVQL